MNLRNQILCKSKSISKDQINNIEYFQIVKGFYTIIKRKNKMKYLLFNKKLKYFNGDNGGGVCVERER